MDARQEVNNFAKGTRQSPHHSIDEYAILGINSAGISMATRSLRWDNLAIVPDTTLG